MSDDRDVRDTHAQAEKVPAVPPVPPVASVPLPPIVGQGLRDGKTPRLKGFSQSWVLLLSL
jgi:hypothetical protein